MLIVVLGLQFKSYLKITEELADMEEIGSLIATMMVIATRM